MLKLTEPANPYVITSADGSCQPTHDYLSWRNLPTHTWLPQLTELANPHVITSADGTCQPTRDYLSWRNVPTHTWLP